MGMDRLFVLSRQNKRLRNGSVPERRMRARCCTAELLSGLRSIEWDLQDLEDTVSIVEGNWKKFELEEADVQERKDFIASTRRQIVSLRDEVQGESMPPGVLTKDSTGPKMPSIPAIGFKSKGYGKVGSQDDAVELLPARDDLDSTNGARLAARASAEDEILGGRPEGSNSAPAFGAGRHRKKKCCLALCALLLLLAAAAVLASHEAESIPALARVHSSLLAAVRSAGVQAAAAPSDVSSSRPPAGSGGAASAGAHARAMLTGEPSALLMALGANPLVALPEAVTSAGYAAGSRRLVLRGETSPWQVAPVTAAQVIRRPSSPFLALCRLLIPPSFSS